MKAVILLTIFSFSLIGFGVQAHFCHGELKALSVAGDADCCSTEHADHNQPAEHDHSDGKCNHEDPIESNCCENGCDPSDDCCKVQVVSDLSDFDLVKIEFPSFNVPKISAVVNPFLIAEFRNTKVHHAFADPIPPGDLTIRYRTLLI